MFVICNKIRCLMSNPPSCKCCSKQVGPRLHAIQCDICDEWIHKKCNKLNDIDYRYLQASTSPWYCIICTSETFPFSLLTDIQLILHLSSNTNINFDVHPPNLSLSPNPTNVNIFNDIDSYISSQIPLGNKNDDHDDTILFPQVNCKYYDIDEFCSSKFNNNDSFSLFHLNIASLTAHFDELNTMINLLDFDFNIIGITETRIKNNIPPTINIDIEGYSIEQTPTEASCGGALLYIANKFQYKTRPDLLLYKIKSLESIFIEILCQNQQNIVVGCIYKHPCMEIDEFISDYLTPLLEKLSSENKSIFLMGDFNINLLQCNDNDHISEYFNMLTSNNILPHITIPTRITNKSSTLIDNIFTNITSSNPTSGNLTLSVSDHLPQFFIIPDKNKKPIPKKHSIYRRNLKNINSKKLLEDFSNTNWDEIINIEKG